MYIQTLRDWLIALNMNLHVGRTNSHNWHANPQFRLMDDIPKDERPRFGSISVLDRVDSGVQSHATGFGATVDEAFSNVARELSGKILRFPVGDYSGKISYVMLPIPRLVHAPGECDDLY
jgi:hypothetical protein